MKLNNKSEITTLDWYDTVLDKIDAESKHDQFKPYLRQHRQIRDSLTGAQVASMFTGCRAQIFNNLVNHMRDHLKTQGWDNADCDAADFAEMYDWFREKELEKYGGKSHHQSEFWALAWGVYSDYMLSAAKKNSIPTSKGVQIHPQARSLFTIKD